MTDEALRQQPHNLDAERAVLGTIMIDNTRLVSVQQDVTVESFYDAGHRAIFEAIIALADRGAPIDPTTVCEDLQRQDRLEVAGGPSYIVQLEGAVLSTTNVRAHSHLVKEKADLRSLITAANSIAEMAYDGELTNDKLAIAADKKVYDVLCAMRPSDSMREISTLTHEMVDKIEETRRLGIRTTGLHTPWPRLNSLLGGGIQPTDSVVLAARTSVGKTAMALNIAAYLAISQKQRVLFFSLEMSPEQLWIRLASQVTGIRGTDLQSPTRMSKNDFDALCASGQQAIGSGNLVIDSTGSLDISVLRARAREQHMLTPLSLVVVDYMQLVTDSSTKRNSNREQEVSGISKKIKALALELYVPVLSLAQLSRQVEQRRGKNAVPQLSDLRESGAIEQDADGVWMLNRPKKDEGGPGSGETTLFVRKNRNGLQGEIAMEFDGPTQRFEEA